MEPQLGASDDSLDISSLADIAHGHPQRRLGRRPPLKHCRRHDSGRILHHRHQIMRARCARSSLLLKSGSRCNLLRGPSRNPAGSNPLSSRAAHFGSTAGHGLGAEAVSDAASERRGESRAHRSPGSTPPRRRPSACISPTRSAPAVRPAPRSRSRLTCCTPAGAAPQHTRSPEGAGRGHVRAPPSGWTHDLRDNLMPSHHDAHAQT